MQSPVDPSSAPAADPGGREEAVVAADPPVSGAAERERDHAWIRRAQAGDEQAFARLVDQHQKRALRLARGMVPSDEDAQDLVQEAFLRVFKSLERFDFQHDFSTWLYRIVTNLAIDLLRRRRPVFSTTHTDGDGEMQLEFEDPDVPAPSRNLEARETGEAVRDCIQSLAPHFQAVLVLRELEGLPCTEIARIVGATHVTVRWRLHRGRKLFQEEWERRQRLAGRALSGPDRANNDSVQSVSESRQVRET
jgi:RNA polymerase sigma-70 factor (ECF subfamily)